MALIQGASAFDPLFGDASDGAITNEAVNVPDATTYVADAAVAPASGYIQRCTGVYTLGGSGAVTVAVQSGQAIGAHSAVCGGYGVPLGAIMSAIGSTAIPPLLRSGDDTASRTGGWYQVLAKGNVTIGAAMTAVATAADASCGGAGGGLIVIVSAGTISGGAGIDVSGVSAHDTGAAKSGGGGYSGEPGGHAGAGGSGGGANANGGAAGSGGAGGAGYIAGNAGGGKVSNRSGGGGGSLENVGPTPDSNNGADGADLTGGYVVSPRGQAVARIAGTDGQGGAGGSGGSVGANGGGGGGAAYGEASGGTDGGNGGDLGSGGGGGGNGISDPDGDGGNGADGNAYFYFLSSTSPYAGMPGGMGAGGGGSGGSGGTDGAGGSAAAGIDAFIASMGNGNGGNGVAGTTPSSNSGGAGGAGGNGGGAAGLCLMIAPTITYDGTVIGKHIKITGTAAAEFIRGFYS